MEEKYLYTIAIIVIFAGFLFTSVGTYTGRVSSIEQDEGQDREIAEQYVSSAAGCLPSEEGMESVVDQDNGAYEVCVDGSRVEKYCHPGEQALQRGDYVVCLA